MNAGEQAYLNGWNEKCAQEGVDPSALAKTAQTGLAPFLRLFRGQGERPEVSGAKARKSRLAEQSTFRGRVGTGAKDVEQGIRGMAGNVKDVAGRAGEAAGDVAGKAKDVAGDVAGKAKDVAEDVSETEAVQQLLAALKTPMGAGAGIGAGLGGLAAMPYALGKDEDEEKKRHRITVPLLVAALGAATGAGIGSLLGNMGSAKQQMYAAHTPGVQPK